MKKIVLLVISSVLLIQCTTIKSHNNHLNNLISEKDLQSDVDFINIKLQQLHPKLYWYISKEDLDYQFDSLKTTITKPLTSFEFYQKISPIIANVRQGHLFVSPSQKIFTRQETQVITKKGNGPFSQFDFELFDNKLYVVRNKSYDKSIKIGTEVVAINGIQTHELLKKYNKWFASDGFNETYKKNAVSRKFSTFYTFENGILDSICYHFRYKDTLKTVSIKRKVIDTTETNKKQSKKKLNAFEKAKIKTDEKQKSIFGYDPNAKIYNRNLRFIEKDSSIAIMKIRSFMEGDFRTFYKESFSKIDWYQSKNLILDLRDNGGGRLNEIAYLYSYLSDSTFVFVDESQVATKTSLFHGDYFKGGSLGIKALKIIFSPLYYGFTFFSVHKNKDGKYYQSINTKPHKVSRDAFKGKIYILINGGSFSASSIISSNLKSSKRAVFVGEETGGAFNGTVAGNMPIVKLPKSNIAVRIGLKAIVPYHKTTMEGRGIFPDVTIVPTIEDRIKGIDPEMNWVLNNIKSNATVTVETSTK